MGLNLIVVGNGVGCSIGSNSLIGCIVRLYFSLQRDKTGGLMDELDASISFVRVNGPPNHDLT